MESSKPKNRSVSERNRKPNNSRESHLASKPEIYNVSMALINTGRKNVSIRIRKPNLENVSFS